MHQIIRKYIKIGSRRIYVQVMGNGPAIALLHPSPHSSDMLLPLASRLADKYTVICIDTPGYGRSDGLESPPKSLSAYTILLHKLFKKMDISQLALYGSATGAQIAIRYALENEDMVSHIFLDNAAHFEDDLRDKILESYFPDLTPSKDGNHLRVLWDIVSNLQVYFPWCFKIKKYYLNRPQLPLEVMHAIVVDFLKAGKHYYYAYKAAFKHEKAMYVQQLKVETNIFKWEGSIVLPYINQLISHDFPHNVKVISIQKDNAARMNAMVDHINEKSIEISDYKMSSTLGIELIEKENIDQIIELPEIKGDGSYLIKAWHLLYEQNENATPEEIQQLLIDGYTT